MLDFGDFIHVYVFTTNHTLKGGHSETTGKGLAIC